MFPRMRATMGRAYGLYYLGCLLLLWGLYDEGAEVFAILVEHNLVGEFLAT